MNAKPSVIEFLWTWYLSCTTPSLPLSNLGVTPNLIFFLLITQHSQIFDASDVSWIRNPIFIILDENYFLFLLRCFWKYDKKSNVKEEWQSLTNSIELPVEYLSGPTKSRICRRSSWFLVWNKLSKEGIIRQKKNISSISIKFINQSLNYF